MGQAARGSGSLGGGRAGAPAGAAPVEGDAAVPQRDERVVPDDDVVEKLDVEKPAGRERLRRQVQVVGRRRGVADGWLWTRIAPAALIRTASRNSSPTRTSEADTLPW